ncbi:MAG: hemolysin III family protein [Chloracidobacterium sp.]|nr:hemolysin III family protein [Chloracidobacterium sp.]
MIRTRMRELPIEEVANALTHGFGLFLSIIGFAVLLVLAVLNGDPWITAGSVVYGLSLIILYTASTVYHGTTSPDLKKLLQIVDHCCIYILIAGTYTPFAMVLSGGLLGPSLLAGVWVLALTGIALKVMFGNRFPILTVTSYVMMGWIGVFAIQPMFEALGAAPVALAVAGGLAYTIGVIFFPWKSIRHHHAIFHVFVMAGSILHYVAVAVYVVPYAANL